MIVSSVTAAARSANSPRSGFDDSPAPVRAFGSRSRAPMMMRALQREAGDVACVAHHAPPVSTTVSSVAAVSATRRALDAESKIAAAPAALPRAGPGPPMPPRSSGCSSYPFIFQISRESRRVRRGTGFRAKIIRTSSRRPPALLRGVRLLSSLGVSCEHLVSDWVLMPSRARPADAPSTWRGVLDESGLKSSVRAGGESLRAARARSPLHHDAARRPSPRDFFGSCVS